MAKEKNGTNLPATVQDRFKFFGVTSVAEFRENIGDDIITPQDLERIKVPTGGMTKWEIQSLEGDSEMSADLRGILIHWKTIRAFWQEAYSGAGTPPDCKSMDGITGTGNPGGVCSQCPFSQWDSDSKGGGGQACKLMRVLFLMRENQILPVVIQAPPTSVKSFKQFFLRMASDSIPFYSVVMSLKLVQTKNKSGIPYSLIVPSIAERLDPDTVKMVKAYADKIRSVLERAAESVVQE